MVTKTHILVLRKVR